MSGRFDALVVARVPRLALITHKCLVGSLIVGLSAFAPDAYGFPGLSSVSQISNVPGVDKIEKVPGGTAVLNEVGNRVQVAANNGVSSIPGADKIEQVVGIGNQINDGRNQVTGILNGVGNGNGSIDPLALVPGTGLGSYSIGSVLGAVGGDGATTAGEDETPIDAAMKQATEDKARLNDQTEGSEKIPGADGKFAGTEEDTVGPGGGRAASIPYLNPMEGPSGLLNDQDALLMVSKAAKSKIGLYNIVSNLTEPGVSQGINNALSQSQDLWSNTVGAEQLRLEMASALPGGQEMAQARINCIANNLTTMPLNQAISRCSGGNKVITPETAAAVPLAPPAGAGAAPTLRETDPNHAKYSAPGLPATPATTFADSKCQDDNVICGTDYIFNQELRRLAENVSVPFLPGQDKASEEATKRLTQARKDFIEFVGDIKFETKIENGNLQTVSATMLAPTAGSADALVGKQQRARYEDFNALMLMYCEWALQVGGRGAGALSESELIRAQYPTEVGDNNPKDVSAAVRDFWRDEIRAKPLRARLSTLTFAMHSKVIEDLFTLYKRDSSFAGRTGSSPVIGGALGGGGGRCDGFKTGRGDPAEYDKLYGSKNSNLPGGVVAPAAQTDGLVNTNSAWHKPIYQLARLIGEASYLDFLGQQGALINNTLMSGIAVPTGVRLEMLNLLNRAAIKRSETGSVTIEEEMYMRAKKIEELVRLMITQPAADSTSQSTAMQAQNLSNMGNQKSNLTGATN